MLATFLKDREEPDGKGAASHLSHSRINRYLHCPEQYRLYYLEKLRTKIPSASLVFGNIIHQALAHLFTGAGDPVECFREMWDFLKPIPLSYSERGSWAKLKSSGEALLKKFVAEELPKLTNVRAVEKPFELTITGLACPFVGVIDLDADLQGTPTVIDFKTAASAYHDHEVILSDQLTAYRLAKPAISQFALCVLVKTKEARIEWHLADRTSGQMTEYLVKVGYVASQVSAARFYKRPGMWCAWCDYLPVCVGNKAEAERTLVKIQ